MSLWLRSRERLLIDYIRGDDPARARRELRHALASGALAVEELAKCPGCGTRRRSWLLATVERMSIQHNTVLCACCGLSYASPRMIPAALDRFYQGLYWRLSSSEAVFRETEDCFARGESIRAWTDGHIPREGLVVELGCGPGYNLVPFTRAGYRSLGFEPDMRCAAFARERLHLDVRPGGLDEFIASGMRADLLIVAHVLEHLPDPRAFLLAAKTALSPTGIMYVEVPGLLNLDHVSYQGDLLSYLQIAHLFNFTRRTLSQYVEAGGFEVLAADESVRLLAKDRGAPGLGTCCREDPISAIKTLNYLKAQERKHVLNLPLRLWQGARSLISRMRK